MENPEKQENNTLENSSLWKPGESGNPSGRPKKGNAWADIITEYLDSSLIEHVVTTINKETGEKKTHTFVVDGKGKSIRKLLVARLINDARNGDKKAFEILMDRECGKPMQGVDLTNNGKSFDAINVTIKEVSSQET